MKDREFRLELSGDVAIRVTRTSAHPVMYAILLVVLSDGDWQTVAVFDNTHDLEEHHEHRYIGSKKQDPIVTYGPVNAAINAALVKLQENWVDIVAEWKRTR